MKYFCVFFLSIIIFFLTNCASLNSVSLTNIPKDTTKTISTTQSKFVFLFMNFNNDYADLLSEDLRNQCQGGVVSGILTKNENICYLPFCFLASNKITAKGFCKL
jgi:hypothetical protein